jgi:large subunit ribosomal protein L24
VVVERAQMVKRHTKPSQKSPQGGIVEKEGSIHISNVMLLDPGSDKPTRVKVKNDGGTRRRVGKSGTVIEAAKQ